MKLIPIENDVKPHNQKGRTPEPPTVSINGATFSLNNTASIALARIHGGSDYAIQLYVSECLGFVGFGVKPSDKVLSSPVKSITSRKVKDMLNLRFGVLKFNLVDHDGVLVADVGSHKKSTEADVLFF